MPVLNRIAHFQNRRDEVPNQELARALAARKDKAGIREIAENLWNDNPQVQSDCLKVLYEIGYLNPDLIASYVDDFLELSQNRNNRLVWGSMIALSTLAESKGDAIVARLADLQKAIANGSVITVDNGIKTLATIASLEESHRRKLFPYLLKHLATCRPKDVPQHSEKIAVAVTAANRAEFVRALERRMKELTATQAARVRRVIAHTGRI
jgi:hypothetical protein